MKEISYWWDFDSNNSIVLESTHPRYPILARFFFNPSIGDGCAMMAIDKCELLISDLKAGRLNHKDCFNNNTE